MSDGLTLASIVFNYYLIGNDLYLIAERTDGKKPSGMISLAFGACAGVVGQTSSYPLDIVRRRMQTAGVKTNGGPDPYKTIMITLRKIYK